MFTVSRDPTVNDLATSHVLLQGLFVDFEIQRSRLDQNVLAEYPSRLTTVARSFRTARMISSSAFPYAGMRVNEFRFLRKHGLSACPRREGKAAQLKSFGLDQQLFRNGWIHDLPCHDINTEEETMLVRKVQFDGSGWGKDAFRCRCGDWSFLVMFRVGRPFTPVVFVDDAEISFPFFSEDQPVRITRCGCTLELAALRGRRVGLTGDGWEFDRVPARLCTRLNEKRITPSTNLRRPAG
jgi:hypothetical protein